MAKNDEKYAYLNQLSTEQLEEILRMDLNSVYKSYAKMSSQMTMHLT